jgi:Protein of unknown function (DUF559)
MDHEPEWPDGPFRRTDLAELGISEKTFRRAVTQHQIRRVVRGVFVVSHAPDTIELRARAVAKAVKPHHVVTDRTAAWLYGIDVHTYGELDVTPDIETCALRWNEPSTLSGVDGRTRDLRPKDIALLHGLRITTPLRTALDLGCCLRRREAYAAVNAFARVFGLTRGDYVRALARYRRRRGVVQLRQLVQLVDPRVESERESWVMLAIHDAGLPLPEPQHWIEIDGVPVYRLDFAYQRLRIVVEYDGIDAHLRTREQQERDEERRAWLRDHGWTVVVVRRGDFTREALDRWIGELREALAPAYTNRRW